MLHDAARRGDVEIPVFCYEPKLGDPVGACRMCLVEIEGMPKLQTSCSTPVRDGMVVHTRTDQVKGAQNARRRVPARQPPARLPGLRQRRRVPAAGHRDGLGARQEPLHRPQAPLREAARRSSPLVAIDRERCILCYRCVRFSQEVAEDAQLQLLERGDRTFVGTFDDRPYVAPFHGNITDLCPVGALTSYTYRFRARPWDIEQAGSVCTLCPSQCNVSFTVRDEQVKRVRRPRQRRGRRRLALRPRPLRLRDVRSRGADRPRRGCKATARPAGRTAIAAAAEGLRGRRRRERGDRRRRLQRGGLPGPAPHARGARLAPRRVPRRARAGPRDACCGSPGRSSRPRVRDIDHAEAILVVGTDPLHSSPILDLRIRKAMRRNRRQAGRGDRAPHRARRRRRGGRPLRARAAPPSSSPSWPPACGSEARAAAASPRGRGPARRRERDDRLGRADRPRGRGGAARPARRRRGARPRRQGRLGPARDPRGGQRPRPARGRLPARRRPGLAKAAAGKGTEGIRAALESGELKTVVLFGVDPLRDFPDTGAWERALEAADHVIAFSMFENATTARADVVFPLETHAEKDGTVTHPDGRLQRIRPSAARPGEVRADLPRAGRALCAALGHDTGIASQTLGPGRPWAKRSPSTPASPTPRSAAAASAGRTARGGLGPSRAWRRRAGAAPRPEVAGASAEPSEGRPRPRHLPRPLGGPDHRAEPAAALPEAGAAGRALAGRCGATRPEDRRRGERRPERHEPAGEGGR